MLHTFGTLRRLAWRLRGTVSICRPRKHWRLSASNSLNGRWKWRMKPRCSESQTTATDQTDTGPNADRPDAFWAKARVSLRCFPGPGSKPMINKLQRPAAEHRRPAETMPSYYFILRRPEGGATDPPRWTVLPNDQSALAYAQHIIRDLKQAGGYDDPCLTLTIQNAEGKTIRSIPFRS
jgi:hypothetical protein